MTRSGFVLLSGIDHEGYRYVGAFDTLHQALVKVREMQRETSSIDMLTIYDVSTDKEVFTSSWRRDRWKDEA
jgi:hypothetical protein